MRHRGGVREHQAAFQAIADANDDEFYPGSRAAGTAGYAAKCRLRRRRDGVAGWEVTLDEVEFQFVFPALLQQLTPVNAVYETGTFTGSGIGDITGRRDPRRHQPRTAAGQHEWLRGAFAEAAVAPRSREPGGPDDFAGFPAGSIALVQRGGCTFAVKAHNAEAAGAEAVIIFNQGNTPDREALIVGTLAARTRRRRADDPCRRRLVRRRRGPLPGRIDGARPRPPSETRTDVNVIAEKQGVHDDNVVMAGAHLDSVGAGPGINDNGSGSAALLEIAQNLANHRPRTRCASRGGRAEEGGLIGSTDYVEGLSQAELDRIALYLNFDMIGSPNYFIGVYDADESSYDAPLVSPADRTSSPTDRPPSRTSSSRTTRLSVSPTTTRSSAAAATTRRSSTTASRRAACSPAPRCRRPRSKRPIWGGTVGAQFDPCYHAACDTFANVAEHALDVNTDAIAFAVLTFASSTESVNGVPGKAVPGSAPLPAPAGPEGTCPGQPTTPCKL